MKFKLLKKQPKKDFIDNVKDNLNEVHGMLNEADSLKQVLITYREKSIDIEYKVPYSQYNTARIEMDDLMVEYLKDRIAKLETRIKERVI